MSEQKGLPGDAAPRVEARMEAPRLLAGDDKALGKYRFIATLGQGGMADVFLAVAMGPAGFSKLQVLKRLRASLLEEPELRTMFLDEARLAARLNHRNIVQTNEIGLIDDQYFIAMEFLDGQPWNRVVGQCRVKGRPLPLSLSLRVLCEVLSGLHYAHELSDYDGKKLHVVHRDVSPHNVFVTYDGQVKVVDFGIAKAERRAVETRAGIIKGKLAYMAPEQAFSPSSEIDRRADVFSVGVMLWEALAGRRLWLDLSDPEIIIRLRDDDLPRLRDVNPTAPRELARICERALCPLAAGRPATALEFRTELELCMADLGLSATHEALGVTVSELFATPRASLRAIVDRRLAILQEEPETAREQAARASLLPRLSSMIPDAADAPVTQPILAVTGSEPSKRVQTRSAEPPPSTLRARSAPPARALRAPKIIALASVSALVFALVWRVTGGAPRPPVAAPPSTAPAAPPPIIAAAPAAPLPIITGAAIPERDTIGARISVSPLEGRILVDGSALPSNPFEGKFIKDGAVHHIQFEASGFFPQRRITIFNHDVALDVVLLPKPRAAAGASAAPLASALPEATAAAVSPSASASTLPAKPSPYDGDRRP